MKVDQKLDKFVFKKGLFVNLVVVTMQKGHFKKELISNLKTSIIQK